MGDMDLVHFSKYLFIFLSDLPNWSLSAALANIQLSRDEEAMGRLETCLRKFPGLLLPLLEAMQAEPCHEIKISPFFNVKEDAGKKARDC